MKKYTRGLSGLISEADRLRISEAVAEAEGKTSGEIVPYVVDRSDAYEVAEWRAGALFGVVAMGIFAAFRQFTEVWLPFTVGDAFLVTLLAGAGGALLTHSVPLLQRFFAGGALLDLRAGQRASQAFVSEEVFRTRDRTGILLFVSLLEHRVVVLGDAGINARVRQDDWDRVVAILTHAVRRRLLADGFVDAIRECGRLLRIQGVARRPDDTDELADDLRMQEGPSES
jgi:putative membrane protein